MLPNYNELKMDHKEEIYENLLLKKILTDLPEEISLQKTWTEYKGRWVESNKSYSFCFNGIANKDISENNFSVIQEGFKKLFNISSSQFDRKFVEACGGKGNEKEKITTIHSSSLCALLHFYKASKEYPLSLRINGKIIPFDEVYFEYKNSVIDQAYPSNIDVVLLSHATNSVLFLESKFAEYINYCGKTYPVSKAYEEKFFSKYIYRNDVLNNYGLKITERVKRDGSVSLSEFNLKSDESCYLEGFKQMVSHYIGLKNLLGENESKEPIVIDENESINRMISEGAEVFLGEILFDNFDFGNGNTYLENYVRVYTKFKILIESVDSNSKINVLPDVLKYTEIKNSGYLLEQRIIDFYYPNL